MSLRHLPGRPGYASWLRETGGLTFAVGNVIILVHFWECQAKRTWLNRLTFPIRSGDCMDHTSRMLPYRQLYEILRSNIPTGGWQPGDMIPLELNGHRSQNGTYPSSVCTSVTVETGTCYAVSCGAS